MKSKQLKNMFDYFKYRCLWLCFISQCIVDIIDPTIEESHYKNKKFPSVISRLEKNKDLFTKIFSCLNIDYDYLIEMLRRVENNKDYLKIRYRKNKSIVYRIIDNIFD